jgi:hypothetical protein
MLFNLLLLVIWAPALLGLGTACYLLLTTVPAARYLDTNATYPGILIILSFVPLAIASSSLHFLMPLGESLSVAALLLGYALLIYHNRILWQVISAQSLLRALSVAILVCLFASRPLRHFDTGLYHIQSVRWCSSFPLVRGLANLHERLGFNSLWTPIAAIVDFPELSDRSSYPLTCLLLFGFGWAIFDVLAGWTDRGQSIPKLFLAACGCFWTWLVTTNSHFVSLPSLSTDAPVYFITFLCIYFLLRFCAENKPIDFSLAVVLSALAVTIKVSAAPLFVFLVLYGVFLLWRDRLRLNVRLKIFAFVTIGSLLLLWVARSVYLSGYLIFPVPATALPFLPWHVPLPMAHQLVDTLKAWARLPGVSPDIALESSAWVSVWLKHLGGKYVSYMIAAYGTLGISLLLLAGWLGRVPRNFARFWPAVAMICLGVIYWFASVPDLRYGCAFLFALASLMLSLGIGAIFRQKVTRVLVCGATLLPLIAVDDVSHFHFRDLPAIEKGFASVKQTQQKTPILVVGGDERIWDGPLPSTPYFRPSLVTRCDANGRIRQFELPEAVHTPYYDRLPAQIRMGLVQEGL